jgi:two-component system sensor histidine kinase BaeS
LFGTYTDAAQQTFYLVSTSTFDLRDRGLAAGYPPSAYSAILAVPQQSVTATWLELAPSLSIAAAISLLVSIVVALFLSRSISGPLAQITRASEAMAAGNYDQTINVRSRDEVGRLASTFNAMAREVANSHRTLRDFLADVSHELKTPLTSIRGFSQAMVDGTLKESAEYVDAGRIINEEAERMARLVEDLLYLSKVESGQESMERQALDLADLLRACIRHWRPQANQAEVEITLDAGENGAITGDMHRLEQVFDNLIFNAINHTPPGGRITVQSQDLKDGRSPHLEPATDAVVVSIHNTGSTIPPQDLPRVFERFYQVGRSAARDARGTGLGLAIVKEIVQAHGGTVEAFSSPDGGTKFVVTLPKNPAPPEHGTPTAIKRRA